jgi:hypothetical protein
MIVSWRKARASLAEALALTAQSYGFSFSLPSKIGKKGRKCGMDVGGGNFFTRQWRA